MGRQRGGARDGRSASVLYVADHDVWPVPSGLAQRLYHLSTGLARRHDVTLLVMTPTGRAGAFPGSELFTDIRHVSYSSCNFARDEARGRAFGSLRRMVHVATQRTPVAVDRFGSDVFADTVQEIVTAGGIDVVWVSRSHFAEQVRRVTDVPIIVDLADIDSEAHGRLTSAEGGLGARLELARLRRWDAGLAMRFAAVVVCKASDVDQVGPGLVRVVRNGYHPGPTSDPNGERTDEVLFVGNLEYWPNVDAVRWFHAEVLPLLRARRPSTRFVIAGRQPRPEVLALDDGDGCIVRADVPDLTETYDRAAVVVVPMRLGSGTRIKSLEAMARGKCLVSTAVGVEGLDVRAGAEVALADSPADMAAACVALLGDPERRRRMGAAARARVATAYSWDVAVAEAEQVVRAVISPGPERGR